MLLGLFETGAIVATLTSVFLWFAGNTVTSEVCGKVVFSSSNAKSHNFVQNCSTEALLL